MLSQCPDPQEIIDKAIELAQFSSWENFSLLELASSLHCDLGQIKSHFRSKDDIAEALFNRADDAMLTAGSTGHFLSGDEGLVAAIMCWFENLAPNKKLVREILAYKLEPGHFHLQAHGITRISRTVQWLLHVSGRSYTGINRVIDEVAVTQAYLASFCFFLFDNSEKHKATRALLTRLISKVSRAESLITRLSRPASR
ncbi:TetR/AcrR family transcriptional regulator [Thalassomonas actiniarum]|uniref:TetR/AcrR family transcriptional regulator n=1 Tax=Thalassomonas actiniarum TaxID=485447 RepID=A0AAF0C1W4_9GAMM|nr:TetR/AcrR family transcriptional regulator [Thalassomonas actiniarum]WDD97180.1 TetR/AcrR family transcriptional regulator [Thalassomonas actiniarum]